MAIKFFDGLGTYKVLDDAASAANGVITGGSGYSATNGRFGGGCLAAPYSSANLSTRLKFAATAAQDEPIYIGYSAWFNNWGDVTIARIINFYGASSNLLGGIGVNTVTGQIYVVDKNATTIATSANGALQSKSWQRIEVRFVSGSTTSNGSIAVHVNGTEILNITGMDTNRASDVLARIETYGATVSTTLSLYIDDVVLWDESGSENNTWLGDLRIDELLPVSNGISQDWVANTGTAWDALNDTPATPDDDTTYIKSSTVDQKASFNVAPVSSPSVAIMAVKARARAKKTDAGDRTVSTYIVSGSTEAVAAAAVDPGTAYRSIHGDLLEADPATGLAWNDTSVNAIQIGVKLAS